MRTPRLSDKQQALLDALQSEPPNRSGSYRGYDLAELSRITGSPPEGLSRTASSLIKRGLVVRFVGGVGRQRVHYSATNF